MNTFIHAIASGYCFYDHGPSGGKGIGSVQPCTVWKPY